MTVAVAADEASTRSISEFAMAAALRLHFLVKVSRPLIIAYNG